MSFLRNTFGFGSSDDDSGQEEPPYDLNYVIGSTTGMDVTQDVPSYIARRAGKFAQFGGETLEILLKNPETFEVDRQELMTTLSGLGFETISLHGDPNIAFTSSQSEQYSAARQYFTDYLNGVARFKSSIEANEEYQFDVSYINMHSSVSQLPDLRSRRIPSATDIFGKDINRVNGIKAPNIYSNKQFLKSILHVLRATEDVELFTLYGEFGVYCTPFNEDWEEAQHMVLNNDIWEDYMDLKAKTDTLSTYSARRAGFSQKLEQAFRSVDGLNLSASEDERIPLGGLLFRILDRLEQGQTDISLGDLDIEFDDEAEENPEDLFEKALSRVWKGGTEEGVLDKRERIPVNAKLQALDTSINFGGGLQRYLRESAAQKQFGNGETVFERALKAFSGDVEYYTRDNEDEYTSEDGKPQYLRIVERLVDSIPLFNRNSGLVYYVIPSWICNSSFEAEQRDVEYNKQARERELHEGWDIPENFIWKHIVGEDKPKPEDGEEYKNRLESDFEFRQDVAAATAAAYTWAHFTVVESDFISERKDQYRSNNEPVIRTGQEGGENLKWIEWMSRHDIGVNLEAFYMGQPGSYFLNWRPKDIAITCHAVNLESSRMGIDESLLKFTIDMEHTASFGVDPENEMDKLIESEKRLASREDLSIDPEKPLANILTAYHLTRPGFETRSNTGHLHGEVRRGDKMLYRYLYRLVEHGFCRSESQCVIVFEIAGNYSEDIFVTRVMMDMLELGVKPSELSPSRVPADGDYENEEQALIARFFGIDEGSKQEEWARIRQNAFNPLKELLEAEDFDNTQSGNHAIGDDVRPNAFQKEEFQ